MKETITLQIGQAGNKIAHKFWGNIAQEHGLSNTGAFLGNLDSQLFGVNSYFTEGITGTYVPRCILLDLDPQALNSICTSAWGELYNPTSFIFSRGGSGNNWATAFFQEGKALLNIISNQFRRYNEKCEKLQGYNIIHSLDGGAGGGLFSLVATYLKDNVRASAMNFALQPSTNLQNSSTAQLNTILTLDYAIDQMDQTVLVENDSLRRLSEKFLEMSNLDTFNDLSSMLLNNMTSSQRFSGKSNVDMRKLGTHLTPMPRLHFLVGSVAPLITDSEYTMHGVGDLIRQTFEPRQTMLEIPPDMSRIVSAALLFRGKGNVSAVSKELKSCTTNRWAHLFAGPRAVKHGAIETSQLGYERSASLIANNAGIVSGFATFVKKVINMQKKGSFLHHYEKAGLEEAARHAAIANVNDLIEDYISASKYRFIKRNSEERRNVSKDTESIPPYATG